MEFIIENWQGILLALTSIVTAASIVAKLTPNKTDDIVIATIKKILDVLAINPKK